MSREISNLSRRVFWLACFFAVPVDAAPFALISCIHQAIGQTTESIIHGQLAVAQNDPEDTPASVTVTIPHKAGTVSLFAADRGDYTLDLGFPNHHLGGVGITSIRENGRDNSAAGDIGGTVFSTAAASVDDHGKLRLSAHPAANLGGTFYSDFPGGTGPSFDGGVAGSTFADTARPVAGFRPVLPRDQPFTANITAIARDWAVGDNYGLAVGSQRVGTGNSHTTDGWQVFSSSATQVDRRPLLSIEYLAPESGPFTEHIFQDGRDGYLETVSAIVRGADDIGPTTSEESTTNGADSPNGSVFIDNDNLLVGDAFGPDVKALLRFENIVSETAIPQNSVVARAYLVMTTTSISNAQTNGPINVHQVLQPWQTDTLESEFGTPGLSAEGNAIGPVLDSVSSIGAYGEAWFDVTGAVQSWADGNTNNGFIVRAETSDGWSIFLQNAVLQDVRPRLVITTLPQGSTPITRTLTFRNGENDYAGNIDRIVSDRVANNADGSAVRQYFIDGYGTRDTDEHAVALLRFEEIFGSGPIQVPSAAPILRADFTLTTATASSNAQSNGSFHIARLLEPFQTFSSGGNINEWNVDLAFAYFPFSQGWVGGWALNESNNSQLNILHGSEGLTIGDETGLDDFVDFVASVPSTGQGYYQLFLPGVDSLSDGILLVGGAKDENNFALSKPVGGFISGWEIVCHDNRVNASPGENDPVAFVYVPLTAVADGKVKAMGRILGDGSTAHRASDGGPLGAGPYSIEKTGTGTYKLTIQGATNQTGTLIITPEGRGQRQTFDENGNESIQNLLNVDNIVNYQWDGTGWIIETRDLPAATLQNLDPEEGLMNFIFIEYGESQNLDAYAAWLLTTDLQAGETDPNFDADSDGLSNFAEFALGTNPTRSDRSKATSFSYSGTGDARQIEFSFNRRAESGDILTTIVEFSTDLENWEPSATAQIAITPPEPGSPYETVTVTDTATSHENRFVRVRVDPKP